MKVGGKSYRSIWPTADGSAVEIIDQTKLPHEFATLRLASAAAAAHAIKSMQVRGAPLIGATAAYGLAMAMASDASDKALAANCEMLKAQRPTAVNLAWAVERMRRKLGPLAGHARAAAAFAEAGAICEEDVAINRRIGEHGLALIGKAAAGKRAGERVNILTHCNAGWIATVDYGTALAPIYLAHDAGIAVHVWVDETRPRNQGAALTAWELAEHGIAHTVIVDNAGGHLMQHGRVDLCLVGTDRVTARGDVCNKIGTYLKALAAHDNGVPFYVATPSPSIDWSVRDGIKEIPIEERGADEVREVAGRTADGKIERVLVTAPQSPAANFAFDVTPARLVTGLVTERGIAPASEAGLLGLFPERAHKLAGE
jgi:methylthioribose-1-phosphate isomerase